MLLRPSLLQPVNDYLLVRKVDHTMTGNLYLPPGTNPIGARYAELVAMGPGRPSEYSGSMIPPMPVTVGATLLIHGGAGTEITNEGESLWFILPRDVMAVVAAAPVPETEGVSR